ncbi:MAG: HNH endonuclease [Candidatus Andersenbacteria bacterium]
MIEKRTYADRREQNIKAVAKRRRKLKAMVIEYKGGKCMICGYTRSAAALELHHVNPKEKSFSLSKRGLTRSWEKTKAEADKCVLICSNCHKEVHAGVTQLPQVIAVE